MNGIAEVREEYKQAAREYIRQAKAKAGVRGTGFYEGKTAGLSVALSCLGVDADDVQEMYALCEERVKDERAQEDVGPGDVSHDEEGFVIEEELDAIERPVAQAQVESDEVTLEHIRARFASPATSADIRNAVQAFKEGFKELDR